jgi:SAM-dependent methyltransferase
VSAPGWFWDESLYAGSAAYYGRGRLPYPVELAEVVRDELGLDGGGRLLDVGCGTGQVGLLLAHLFEEVVGVDADAGMVAKARREAERRGVVNARWLRLRAEDLPAGLGVFRIACFAQSFHWFDRARVAEAVRAMLEPGGALLHVEATTHQGVEGAIGLPAPAPPRAEIAQLIQRYLGPVRRAGRRTLPGGTASGEDEVIAAAGFTGPHCLTAGGGHVFERSEDDVVASVFSLSWAAPHLFGERLGQFEEELRLLLRGVSSEGRFAEEAGAVAVDVWRP